jgi:undecaprenol kinase/diacylglycerol kinase (ATP)
VAIAFVLTLGYYVKLEITDWLWVSLAIAVVLITELVNTAIEVLVDLVSPQKQIKAGIIKDVAAAAVLLSTLFAVVIFILIFTPKFN